MKKASRFYKEELGLERKYDIRGLVTLKHGLSSRYKNRKENGRVKETLLLRFFDGKQGFNCNYDCGWCGECCDEGDDISGPVVEQV